MKENQRVVLTKRLLKESLLDMLRTDSIDRINVTQLCGRAGINRATFYRHYSSPQDVLQDIEQDLEEEIRAAAPVPHTIAQAQMFTEAVCTCMLRHADIVRTLIRSNSDQGLSHMLDSSYQMLLERNARTSMGSRLDADELQLVLTFYVGGIYLVLRRWLMEEIDKTPAQVAQLIFRFIDKDAM